MALIRRSSMPVTHHLAERIGPGRLAGLAILHINHLLKDVLELNEILVGLGARLIFVPVIYGEKALPAGLPYPFIYAYPEAGQFRLHRDGAPLPQTAPRFEQAMREAILEALALWEATAPPGERLLIIEDGGYHYELFGAGGRPPPAALIGAIEQTVAGVRLARRFIDSNGAALYPILSVARSKLKVRFENYFIARRIVEETSLLLYEIEEFLDMKEVLLLGYGVLGRPLAALLRKLNCRVTVVEANVQVRHTATCDGFEVAEAVTPEIFEQSTLVLGVTGRPAFTPEMFVAFLRGAARTLYLASGSSKQVEFAALSELLAPAPGASGELGQIEGVVAERGPHGVSYHFSHRGAPRSVVLLAEGYPVNFYRPASQSLSGRVIDPINAELLLLAHYLHRKQGALHHRLYLLGHDFLPSLGMSEEELMELWARSNEISPSLLSAGIWQSLSPHPNELWLTTS